MQNYRQVEVALVVMIAARAASERDDINQPLAITLAHGREIVVQGLSLLSVHGHLLQVLYVVPRWWQIVNDTFL